MGLLRYSRIAMLQLDWLRIAAEELGGAAYGLSFAGSFAGPPAAGMAKCDAVLRHRARLLGILEEGISSVRTVHPLHDRALA